MRPVVCAPEIMLESKAADPRVSDVLAAATRDLNANQDSPRLEAEILLAHALGAKRTALHARPEAPLAGAIMARFRVLLARRLAGEPIAYITGVREFWSVDFEVGPDVLIPRPETERLVEAALGRIPACAHARVLDLGTGCGAIAVAIALERPKAQVYAMDVSEKALSLAARNISRCGARNVRLFAADWLDAVGETDFDVIVSNPPYVADGDAHLRQGDVRFEPRLALAAGRAGFDAIREIAASARGRLAQDGCLLLEHGFDQGHRVRGLLRRLGYGGVFTLDDLSGHQRVSGGRRSI